MKKTVCGIGINDMPRGWSKASNENERLYQLWSSMLKRCYSGHENYVAYEDCVVCEEWQTLSNFVREIKNVDNYDKWLNNKGQYSLDKDIKRGRCKIYSPEHCMFVTTIMNTLERNENGQFSAQPKPIIAYNENTGKIIEFKTERDVEDHEEQFSRGGVRPSINNGFKTYRDYRWFTKDAFEKFMNRTLGVIDCKSVKNEIIEEIKQELKEIKEMPTLAIVQVLGDKASDIYVKNKEKLCNELGIHSVVIKMTEDITQKELEESIAELASDSDVHGIMLQLPLPKHLDSQKAIDMIPYLKDVDALSTKSQGLIFTGQLEKGLQPCTPLGVLKILDSINYDVQGKNICVVGRSQLFGNTMSQLLMRKNATVTLAHSKTENLKEITKNSDCVISAIGVSLLLDSSYFSKKTEVVIDVGMSLVDGKLKGDVNTNDIIGKVPLYTITPNGTGQTTVPMLLLNTVKAYKLQRGEEYEG